LYARQGNEAVVLTTHQPSQHLSLFYASYHYNISIKNLFTMPDPFSVAASSFAVVGVVDVLLRASVECCRFLSEIKGAPEEIDRLRTSITENNQLFETSKKYLDDLQNPTSPICSPDADVQLSQALDQLKSSLRALQREIEALSILAKRFSGKDKAWMRFKFLLDTKKINKCLEKLERTKSTLSVVLSLVEGRRSALGQKRVEGMVQQRFQQMTYGMDAQMQELSRARAGQEKILEKQETVISHSTQQLKTANLVRKDIGRANRRYQIEHTTTRRVIAEGNREVLDTISSSFKDLRLTLPKPRTSTREIAIFGHTRDGILTPLLLMKDLVRRAVVNILSEGGGRVSAQRLNWLQTEFENLVSSATQEAAALCPGSTATPFDRWNYSARDVGSSRAAASENVLDPGDDRKAETSAKRLPNGSYDTANRKRIPPSYRVFSSSSPVGTLKIMVPWLSNATKFTHDFNEIHLSFLPSMGICSTGIGARFLQSMKHEFEPRLHAQLIAFRLVEYTDLYYSLIGRGTLEEIDTAFRCGTISPYDRTMGGTVACVWAAALYDRLDVFKYLESQGIGLSTLNGGLDALEAVWWSFQQQHREDVIRPIEHYYQIMNYFNQNISPGILSSTSGMLVARSLEKENQFTDERVKVMRAWLQLLQQDGFDFNLSDESDYTPLDEYLLLQGRGSLTFVRLLIELGTDVHTVNRAGSNAIHVAMLSNIRYGGKELPEILEEKLSLLIELGVDLHQRDHNGFTPSMVSRFPTECFAVWCRALERNGLKIEDVVLEERELWQSGEGLHFKSLFWWKERLWYPGEDFRHEIWRIIKGQTVGEIEADDSDDNDDNELDKVEKEV
jgi:hypothetical protein